MYCNPLVLHLQSMVGQFGGSVGRSDFPEDTPLSDRLLRNMDLSQAESVRLELEKQQWLKEKYVYAGLLAFLVSLSYGGMGCECPHSLAIETVASWGEQILHLMGLLKEGSIARSQDFETHNWRK